MKQYSSYRLIEIDEKGQIWEILDEYSESVLIDQERIKMGKPTILLLPFDIFEEECHTWH